MTHPETDRPIQLVGAWIMLEAMLEPYDDAGSGFIFVKADFRLPPSWSASIFGLIRPESGRDQRSRWAARILTFGGGEFGGPAPAEWALEAAQSQFEGSGGLPGQVVATAELAGIWAGLRGQAWIDAVRATIERVGPELGV